MDIAEDLYMPEGPPRSPLTRSYFTCGRFRCVRASDQRNHRHYDS